MSGLSDHELRAGFEALRAADEQEAPGFTTVLDRAKRAPLADPRPRVRRRLQVALSIAAALLLAAGVVRVFRRPDFVPPPLSTWTSPTASLLRTSGADLLASPTLLSSVLDQLTSMPPQHQGK
jgi:hypothetical protein